MLIAETRWFLHLPSTGGWVALIVVGLFFVFLLWAQQFDPWDGGWGCLVPIVFVPLVAIIMYCFFITDQPLY